MADDVYPPIFFLLLHGLNRFTMDTFLLRLPMALAGVASVGILMLLLRRFAGTRAALFAGALAAVSPILVYYSQEMKMYSILALFLLLLFHETVLCLDDSQRGWKRLALWALLSIYTFYLAAIVWFCLLVIAAWKTRRNLREAASVWKGYGVAALLFLPWLPFFIKSVVVNRGSVQNFLMDRIFIFSFQNFSLGFWGADWLNWCGLLAFGTLVFVGLSKFRRESPWFPWLVAGLTFLPLALSWVVSLTAKPMYSDRAMLVSALGWLALAGMGLSRLKGRLAWPAFILVFGLSLFSLRLYYFDSLSRRIDYLPAWKHVIEQWQPGDSIFHQNIDSYYPFKFYALQEARQPLVSPYKDEPGAALGPDSARLPGVRPNWIHTPPPAFSSSEAAGGFRKIWRQINAWLQTKGHGIYTGYNRDFIYTPRLEKEALPGVQRIWYLNTDKVGAFRIWMPQMNVFRHGYDNWIPFEPEKLGWLHHNFKLVMQQRVDDVDIYLFEKTKLAGGKRK